MDDVASGVLHLSPHDSCLAPIRCRTSLLSSCVPLSEKPLFFDGFCAEAPSQHLNQWPSFEWTINYRSNSWRTRLISYCGQGRAARLNRSVRAEKETDWAFRTGQNERAEASARTLPMASSKRGPSVLVSQILPTFFPPLHHSS